MTAPPAALDSGRELDRLELAALAYLLLPLPIFFVTWLRWPAALVLSALLVCSCVPVWRRHAASIAIPRRLWLSATLVGFVWVGASGLAGFLPLNEDWQVRMVVLRDMVVGAWPVGYGPRDGGEAVLRFSMGYYIVPAVIGKVAGVAAARIALALWTMAGCALVFALAASSADVRQRWGVATLLLVFVGFSGLDVPAWWAQTGALPALGEHVEWWNQLMQYSSHTTLLFWAPNHALPAWLGVAIVWRHRHAGLAATPMAVLLLAAALWSPLATVGLAPLALVCCLRAVPLRVALPDLLRPAVLAVVPATLLLAQFVSFGIPEKVVQTAVAMTEMQIGLVPMLLPFLSRFALVEWAGVALLLGLACRGYKRLPWPFWVATVELLCLPLLRFGPGNDVVMRGGIAPIAVLALLAASALADRNGPRRWRAVLAVVLALGALTAWQELSRQWLPGSRWPDDGSSLRKFKGTPWHYIGVLQPGWMQRVALQPPIVLPEQLPDSAAGAASDARR